MIPNSMMFRIASTLTAAGIVLALVTWYARPESPAAWAAVLGMFIVMGVALRLSWRAIRVTTDAATIRGLERIPTAVVFAALMMGIPLALSLARSYGFTDDFDVARRSTGFLTGIFLAMLGNVMPKDLPPLSSGCDPVRQRAYQRFAGWAWVLCGLASAIGWLVLPTDLAQNATIVLVVSAVALTVGNLVRMVGRARRTGS